MLPPRWPAADVALDFDHLFREARPRLLALARRLVRSEADAEDVVQIAFESGLRHRHRFEARARATSWLYRITYNAALMHLRACRRRPAESLDALPPEVRDAVLSAAEPASSPERRVEEDELGRALLEATSALSPLDRRIVGMRLADERPTREVADAVGLTPAATKTRLHRAREALKARLEGVGAALAPV